MILKLLYVFILNSVITGKDLPIWFTIDTWMALIKDRT